MAQGDSYDFLGRSVEMRLEQKLREGRRRALGKVTRCRVTLTLEGGATRDEVFQTTPTLGQVVERIGANAAVVALAVQRQNMYATERMIIPTR
jgi:hypothetical protein